MVRNVVLCVWLSTFGTACGGHITDAKFASAVDHCALLAEEAHEDGASVTEATRIFDQCVARIQP